MLIKSPPSRSGFWAVREAFTPSTMRSAPLLTFRTPEMSETPVRVREPPVIWRVSSVMMPPTLMLPLEMVTALPGFRGKATMSLSAGRVPLSQLAGLFQSPPSALMKTLVAVTTLKWRSSGMVPRALPLRSCRLGASRRKV